MASAFTAALAAVIDAKRLEQGLSRNELARRSGLPKASVGKKLDEGREITMRDLSQFSGALGLSRLELVAEAEKEVTR